MKVKRNKRVEENLRIRTARVRGERHRSFLSFGSFQDTLGSKWAARTKRSKSFLTLLEQDLAAQAERLQRLESSLVMEFHELTQLDRLGQPALEPVMVSEEPEMSEPTEEVDAIVTETASKPAQAVRQSNVSWSSGRSNYQYAAPAKRVRRRAISL